MNEKFGSHARKPFNKLTIKDSYTWNIIYNRESTAVSNLKPEWWGSPLVQEKYQMKRPVATENNNNNNNNNISVSLCNGKINL